MEFDPEKIKDLKVWNTAEHLDSFQVIKFFLEDIISDGTPEELKQAMETCLNSKFYKELT